MLKSYPGKDKLTLVLEPLAREQMLPHNTMLSRGAFIKSQCEKLGQEFGLKFDCSFLEDDVQD